MISRTPSVNAVAVAIMSSKAASVSTSSRVARIAATESGEPGEGAADAAHVDDVEVGAVEDALGELG